MDEKIQKDLCQGEGKKGRHPPAFPRHMGSGLHVETGCREFHAGIAFELLKKIYGGDGDVRGWLWQKLRPQPVS